MEQDECRSCHAPVIWAMTVKGKLMPVDKEPSAKGNIELRQRADGSFYAEYHTIKAGGIEYHTSHFATCPQSKAWRKRKDK